MLHLKFALNLEHLADEMIEEISKNWNDPFNAPVVIFPDPKLEQWFRLKWIKKNGILANLNKSTIDRFLFDILVGDDDTKLKLSADMVRNVILAYLGQDDETDAEKKHWQTLAPEVYRYLSDENGNLDENCLFDFASKMASLFLEYETSRPAGFARNSKGEAPGILEKWKDGALQPFFAESNNADDVVEREAWQQKLYSAIFHGGEKSLLSQVFEKENQRKGRTKAEQKIDYLTIPYLFSLCEKREKEGKKPFFENKLNGAPVFIFGLSGMGQFYRMILQKFAERHDIYAYIQNPCMEFWEDLSSVRDSKNVCRSWDVSKDGKWHSTENADMSGIQERMSVQKVVDAPEKNPVTDVEDVPENALSDQENDLLLNWGRTGRDNVKLWCQATDYDFIFQGAEKSNLPQDTLLHKIQYSVAHREPLCKVEKAELTDGSLDVTAAPTKIREIENLHTQICALLGDREKKIRVEDILVVSPCLDEYRTAISMVFDQTAAKPDERTKKEKGFLHIPFAIVDSPAKNSHTENALKSLFAILNQGTVTRPDFFALIRNPVVQFTRGINNDEVDAWQQWVTNTNTYRRRDESDGDWNKTVRRLLLSQMTAEDFTYDESEKLRPYSDMACSNKASLCRFIECIKELEKWIGFGQSNCSDLEQLSEYLDKWIALNQVPNSLKGEAIVYKRVAEGLEQLHWQMEAGSDSLSMKIIEQSLLFAAQGTEYSCGNLFVNGITFMKFAPNRILPVKHLFFIGADAESFPGSRQRNTVDLRKSCYPWPGDDSPVARNRYGFLSLLMSAGESFHLSYVDRDLKKDAEHYSSSVVNDLRKFIENSTALDEDGKPLKWGEKEISLDENRKYNELWTPKSLRNRNAYEWMNLGEEERLEKIRSYVLEKLNQETSKTKEHLVKIPERVNFYSLSSFLKDPFEFRVNSMLMEEEDEDVEKEIFEPVFFNHLDVALILKKMVAAELSGENSDEKKELEKLQENLELTGKMPKDVFGKKQQAILNAKKALILDQIRKQGEFSAEWSFGGKIQDLQLVRTDGTSWNLSGRLDWCNADPNALENTTHIMEVTSTETDRDELSFDKYMSPYIKALALIAYKGVKDDSSADKSQTIKISIYSCDKDKNGPAMTQVTMTPLEAKKKLEEIYTEAFGDKDCKTFPYSKSVPASMLEGWPKDPEDKTIFGYRDELIGEHGKWAYFDKKTLFNPLTDVGFSVKNFEREWDDAVEKMNGLIAIKKYKTPEEPKEEKPAKSKDEKNAKAKDDKPAKSKKTRAKKVEE